VITIKTATEVEKMRIAGQITAGALSKVRDMLAPGVTTMALDTAARSYIEKHGATPSFLGYRDFPYSITVSINEEVIHGLPSSRKLMEGDIVGIDIGAFKDGYHGDMCRTFAIGKITPEAQRLIDVTRQSYFEGIKHARVGYRLHDITRAIQSYAEAAGYSVVRDYIGHGIGRNLHEDPDIPNAGAKGRGPALAKGMTLAVEPMINAGRFEVYTRGDNWTVVTKDGQLSAHYENTILVTDEEPLCLTLFDD